MLNTKYTDNGNDNLEVVDKDAGLPVGYLSSTQVTMYLRCPAQYNFRYVRDIKIPPNMNLVEGITHHQVQEYNNNQYVETNEFVEEDILSDCFVHNLSVNMEEIQDKKEKENKDEVIQRGTKLISDYCNYYRDLFIPIKKPEQRIEIRISDIPFVLVTDIVSSEGVFDYKVVGRQKSKTDVDRDFQLTAYSYSEGNKNVGFISFVKTKQPKIDVINSRRDESHYNDMKEIVRGVANGIKKGVFPRCDPLTTLCSPKFCGYWSMCRGRK
jgi:hypothetical protein